MAEQIEKASDTEVKITRPVEETISLTELKNKLGGIDKLIQDQTTIFNRSLAGITTEKQLIEQRIAQAIALGVKDNPRIDVVPLDTPIEEIK